jgi:transcriptional regulator with XRE-family HTH domain
MNTGYAIKFCRQQRRLTIPQLAKKAGLSTSYVSLLENNARDPSLSALQKIAGGLNVPLSVLIFVGTPPAELESLSPEIAEKLAAATMKLLRYDDSAEQQQSLV